MKFHCLKWATLVNNQLKDLFGLKMMWVRCSLVVEIFSPLPEINHKFHRLRSVKNTESWLKHIDMNIRLRIIEDQPNSTSPDLLKTNNKIYECVACHRGHHFICAEYPSDAVMTFQASLMDRKDSSSAGLSQPAWQAYKRKRREFERRRLIHTQN